MLLTDLITCGLGTNKIIFDERAPWGEFTLELAQQLFVACLSVEYFGRRPILLLIPAHAVLFVKGGWVKPLGGSLFGMLTQELVMPELAHQCFEFLGGEMPPGKCQLCAAITDKGQVLLGAF